MREAHRIFHRDLRAAWEDRDYNLVVRRAQEAVELAPKGVVRILGADFPKVRDVGPIFARESRRKGGAISEEELAEVQRISAWLVEAWSPAFYLEGPYGEGDARAAREGAWSVLDVVTRVVEGGLCTPDSRSTRAMSQEILSCSVPNGGGGTPPLRTGGLPSTTGPASFTAPFLHPRHAGPGAAKGVPLHPGEHVGARSARSGKEGPWLVASAEGSSPPWYCSPPRSLTRPLWLRPSSPFNSGSGSTLSGFVWCARHVLAHYRNVRAGDGWEFAVTPPDGAFTWSWTPRTSRDYSDYYLVHLIPLAGTPNEERTGTWRVTVSHQGNQQQAQFDVVAADRSALEAAKAEQAARPQDFVANYRLGAAASMFGENELAVSSLSRASEIGRRSPYPHVALCRHFLRTQQKEQARQACATARGLLLGYDDRSLSGWLLAEIESLLRQAD